MSFHRIFIMAALLLSAHSLFAQKQYSDADYRRHPHWITMMNDTAANYFETEKAFTLFWQHRIKPVEEHDILGAGREKERKTFLAKLFKSRKEKQREESEMYAFQYKKFRHWEILVAPYVQDNGRILTPAERLETWKQHKAIN